jgi:hypothetical protein
MKLTLEWDGSQEPLGFDDNFDLVDSIIYMMDYDLPDPDGLIRDGHNGIKLTLDKSSSPNSLSSTSSTQSAQESLENIAELFDDFYRQAQEFIDKQKEKE